MEKIKLTAKTRGIKGKKVKNLRKQGLLPAVLYGQGKNAQNLEINIKKFEKIYKKAGTSTLVDLTIDDKSPIKVLFYEPQLNPVDDTPIHADIYKIRMDQKITTEIPLKFVGEAPAVKELEGNLIKSKDSLEIECLPGDLLSEIEVDISSLKTFDDVVNIGNLNIPENIKVLAEESDTVLSVTPPRSEEELKAMEEEATADQEKAQVEKMEAQAQADKGEEEKTGKEKTSEGDKGSEEKPAEGGEKKEEK